MNQPSWAPILYRIGQSIGALSAGVIALLTVTDVLMRYFFNNAIFGAAEVTNALLAMLVGAGLIVVAALRIHICVDLFDGPLRRLAPTGYPRWILVWEVLGTAALAALLMRHAWHTIEFGELTSVLEFPIGWVYALVAALVVAALAVLISGWRPPAEHETDSV
jgi:TRAP-type C4-dicarboxylate transport system permease small subunit